MGLKNKQTADNGPTKRKERKENGIRRSNSEQKKQEGEREEVGEYQGIIMANPTPASFEAKPQLRRTKKKTNSSKASRIPIAGIWEPGDLSTGEGKMTQATVKNASIVKISNPVQSHKER
jgi:hypothetical protein